jgi:hypothetical protein
MSADVQFRGDAAARTYEGSRLGAGLLVLAGHRFEVPLGRTVAL